MQAVDKTADPSSAIPDVDVLLKGLLGQPGVDGVLIYNDLGEVTIFISDQSSSSHSPATNFRVCLYKKATRLKV